MFNDLKHKPNFTLQHTSYIAITDLERKKENLLENVVAVARKAHTSIFNHLQLPVDGGTLITGISGCGILSEVAFGLQLVDEIDPLLPGVSGYLIGREDGSLGIERRSGGDAALEAEGVRKACYVEFKEWGM